MDTVHHHFNEILFINSLKIVYLPDKLDITFSLNYEIHAKNLNNPIKFY